MFLYITADNIGADSGGGSVTKEESEALKTLGPCNVLGREELDRVDAALWKGLLKPDLQDPWIWDTLAGHGSWIVKPALAHFYAGTFSKTIDKLKKEGAKISYTCAAHDIAVSRHEHMRQGIPFSHPHLTEPDLWRRYIAGYLAADVVICPSRHSANICRGYGCKNVEVIPHGVDLPDPGKIKPLPAKLVCGYLGAYGCDKGVIYLLQAWKRLNLKDGLLILAGRDSTHPFVVDMVNKHGGGNIWCRGWVNDVADFYNSISLYVQPSATEGWGLEVLEALSFGRPVVCSGGAGAVDCIRHRANGMIVPSCAAERIADAIQEYRDGGREMLVSQGNEALETVKGWYTWDLVRKRYVQIWRDLLA